VPDASTTPKKPGSAQGERGVYWGQRFGMHRVRRAVKVKILMANLLDRITLDPRIAHGKPTIRGLRYPVETMLELMSGGMSIDEILADYEDLERDDLLAVLAFAARLSQVKRMQPIGS